MPHVPNETTLRLSISGEDWTLIETALTAYDHNAVYRDLRDRLDMQVAMIRAMDGATRNAGSGQVRDASGSSRSTARQSR